MEIKKTVLIVEDEASYQQLMKDRLTKEGFNVLQAKNGEEGLALALDRQPDLILLDVVMPKMGGMEVLRKLREENKWGQSVPVFILTNLSSDDEERINDVTELLPTYYLEKTKATLAEVVLKIKDKLEISQ